jgi:hypothetical protein
MLNRAASNHSHQFIVRFKYSKISLHFCKDSRIFCEGVKDDEGVFVKQQSANNPDADRKWRRSSKSNNEANDERLFVYTNDTNKSAVTSKLIVVCNWTKISFIFREDGSIF